jgi:hypothetical protein
MSLVGWLRRQPCNDPGSSSSPTHVFLNGGKAYVEDTHEARRGFLEAYAEDVLAGRPLYVVERAGESYRMFADFDIDLDSTQLPTTHVPTLVSHALSCFPNDLVQVHDDEAVTVCIKPKTENMKKIGAHLIWTHLCVNDEIARGLRDAWVAALDPEAAWDATIDAAVYRRNGLRMPWSRKRDDLTGTGVYMPAFVWSHRYQQLAPWTPQMTKAGVVDALVRCSIHPAYSSSSCIVTLPLTMMRKYCTARTTAASTTSCASNNAIIIQRALCALDLDPYATATRIHVASGDGRNILFSCLPPSKECRIAGRSHRSNHIYYHLQWDHDREEWHLRQRCHSAKCAGQCASVCFLLPNGHASGTTVSAQKSVQQAIASTADRWMSRLTI